MSLILEALKKLEREKQTGQRGFVVLSHLPWAGARSGRGALAVGLLVVAALTVGAAALWRSRSAPPASGGPGVAAPLERAAPPSAAPPASAIPALPPPPGMVTPPPAETRPAAIGAPETPAERLHAPEESAAGLADAETTEAARAGPVEPAARAVELRLHAISVRDGHPVAIVNDRLVREGDRFDGIHVLRIGETEVEVEVEVGGERRTLRF